MATIVRWRPTTSSRLSHRRRATTASCSRAGTFDWLCEQGHVGLERVAKARRDPALAGPGDRGGRAARCDLRTPRGRQLGAPRRRARTCCSRRPGARADGNADPARRPGALHLVPPDRARAVPRRRRAGLRPRGAQGAVPRVVRDDRRPRRAAWPPRASASAACSASGRTTTRSSTSQPRRWAIRRSFGSRPSTATGPAPTARAAGATAASAGPELGGQLRSVDDGDVDRPAAAAAHAHLLRHLHRVHRDREDVAALDADVVVGAVAVEDRPVGIVLDRGPAVRGALRPSRIRPHRDASPSAPQAQSAPSLPAKSVISASSTPTTTPSPIDAALPVIWAFVWIVPPPSRERERRRSRSRDPDRRPRAT